MKHLIVIADPYGGKNSALKRALELQRRTGAHITLLGFCYAAVGHTEDAGTDKLSRRKLENALVKRRGEELTEVVKKLKGDTRQVSINILWNKHIDQAATAYCKEHPVDILLKSGNHQGSWLYTSTDWQLIRECPAPVMITAGKSWKKKSRIVVAVDFATEIAAKKKLNDKLVSHAKALADVLNDEIHLAFALTIPEPLADLDLINPRKYAAEKRKKLQPAVNAFCESHGIADDRVHIKQGKAGKIIPSIASSLKADLVIAGTVGRKGVKGKLLGNTAEGILSNLYTDILAIKP